MPAELPRHSPEVHAPSATEPAPSLARQDADEAEDAPEPLAAQALAQPGNPAVAEVAMAALDRARGVTRASSHGEGGEPPQWEGSRTMESATDEPGMGMAGALAAAAAAAGLLLAVAPRARRALRPRGGDALPSGRSNEAPEPLISEPAPKESPQAQSTVYTVSAPAALQASSGPVLTLHSPAQVMAAAQHIDTADMLALATALCDKDASPQMCLKVLQQGHGLPIESIADSVAGLYTTKGNTVKAHNEDFGLAMRSYGALWPQGADILMVFDGMGGMANGRLASRLAALFMTIELHRLQDTVPSDINAHLLAAFDRVHGRFRKASRQLHEGQLKADGMRTTAIVLVATTQAYHLAHQGDGHAHVRRAQGQCLALMQPHKGAHANVVTRSLGPVPDGDTAISRVERLPGDTLYLATDGFDPIPPGSMLDNLAALMPCQPVNALLAQITEDCRLVEDEHGLICDDNMTLAALHTPHAQQTALPLVAPGNPAAAVI